MFESYTTVVGTVVTTPHRRRTPGGDEVLSFRVASTARRRDQASGEWVDGSKLYLTVTCWGRLAVAVSASLDKGDPVLVYGDIRSDEYVTREGVQRSGIEMRAVGVGPDLARCAVRRVDRRSEPASAETVPDPVATSPESLPVTVGSVPEPVPDRAA